MLLPLLLQACLGFLPSVLSLQAWSAQSTSNQGHLFDYRGLSCNLELAMSFPGEHVLTKSYDT